MESVVVVWGGMFSAILLFPFTSISSFQVEFVSLSFELVVEKLERCSMGLAA